MGKVIHNVIRFIIFLIAVFMTVIILIRAHEILTKEGDPEFDSHNTDKHLACLHGNYFHTGDLSTELDLLSCRKGRVDVTIEGNLTEKGKVLTFGVVRVEGDFLGTIRARGYDFMGKRGPNSYFKEVP